MHLLAFLWMIRHFHCCAIRSISKVLVRREFCPLKPAVFSPKNTFFKVAITAVLNQVDRLVTSGGDIVIEL